jgi:hypothetical protein
MKRTLKMKPVIEYALLVSACFAQIGKGADPLDSWTATSSGTQNGLYAVAYGNNQFVAVGGGGTVVTSPDGVTWTERNSGTTNWLGSIAFGNGQFVAVGGVAPAIAATIVTSPDGITWTPRNAGTTNTFYAVAYGDGQFVAVSGAGVALGTIVSSANGADWTTRFFLTNTSLPSFSGVAYGNGQFVALAGGFEVGPEAVVTSPDGITWTLYEGIGPSCARAVTFGNGQFVAVGGRSGPEDRVLLYHGVIYTSTDGVWWTLREDVVNSGNGWFYSVAYGGGQFVAVGDLTYSSADGTNWVGRNFIGLSEIGYGNGRFVGLKGSTIMQSGVIGKLGASLSPTGQFLGTVTGVTGQSYAIQTSTNLWDWSTLRNVTISNWTAQFSDLSATNFSRRFYKATGVTQ